jgi:uncharacterized membrane protein
MDQLQQAEQVIMQLLKGLAEVAADLGVEQADQQEIIAQHCQAAPEVKQ